MSDLKAFTTLLSDFLTELSVVFPAQPELTAYRAFVDGMIRIDPSWLHGMFKKHMLPFKEQILRKDEAFFLQHSFDMVTGFNSEREYTIARKGQIGDLDMLQPVRIRELWKAMSEQSKDNTHQYLCRLVQVAEKV